MPEKERWPARAAGVQRSVEMLKLVLEGETYDAVAAEAGVTRTAVERRIKSVAGQLSQRVGIEGLNRDATAFVQRLRRHRVAILAALDEFEPATPFGPRTSRVLANDEIARAAQRIKVRSSRPWHDQALFYLLFATGARPLEIARLARLSQLTVALTQNGPFCARKSLIRIAASRQNACSEDFGRCRPERRFVQCRACSCAANAARKTARSTNTGAWSRTAAWPMAV